MEKHKDKTWCERIFDALFAAEAGAERDIDAGNEPEWVVNVLKQLVQQSMLAVSLKPNEITPRRLGRLLGQLCANWSAIQKACAMNLTPEKATQAAAIVEQLEKNADNPAVASLFQAFEFTENALVSTEPLMDQYNKITLDALKTAWGQPDHLERLAFFQGVAEGLSKPGFPARFTDATPIYQRLFFYRRDVEKLKSVRELRDFFRERGLSQHVLGEPKRLEKICERIGLSFAKRGRPKTAN